MNLKKLKNIIELNSKDRFDYSIREFVKTNLIWAIATDDSWVTIMDIEGDEIFPIWPHKEVAEFCILEEQKIQNYLIQSILYENFIEFCIPDMVDNNIHFGIFYNKNREAISIHGLDLLEKLKQEEELE